jgi:hypothetical protein
MTVWDFLNNILGFFPPIVAGTLLAVAGGVFIHGFNRHGMDFLKHGLKQTALDVSLENRFRDMEASHVALNSSIESRFDALEQSINGLRTEMQTEINGIKNEVGGLRTEIDTIKNNHFAHLKNYLTVLDGILLDKNVISNQDKARLDNELRGM